MLVPCRWQALSRSLERVVAVHGDAGDDQHGLKVHSVVDLDMGNKYPVPTDADVNKHLTAPMDLDAMQAEPSPSWQATDAATAGTGQRSQHPVAAGGGSLQEAPPQTGWTATVTGSDATKPAIGLAATDSATAQPPSSSAGQQAGAAATPCAAAAAGSQTEEDTASAERSGMAAAAAAAEAAAEAAAAPSGTPAGVLIASTEVVDLTEEAMCLIRGECAGSQQEGSLLVAVDGRSQDVTASPPLSPDATQLYESHCPAEVGFCVHLARALG